MRTHLVLITLVISLLLFSCASIVSKSNWPVSIDSKPSGASVTIFNKKGAEVYTGKTPASLKLKSGSGFFSKESYSIVLSKDGFETKKINLECRVNGWYWGNILIGGIIGMLIVDPATGAMYKLDKEFVDVNLTAVSPTASTSPEIKILDKNNIPDNWKQHLIEVK
ncbi:PEGA domain-containing protein [Foetidibacter luteolus]|uniref:PEGA domain-containing protein n=1 Tax=Foetidibacter luteolus TaxID=2608880 RepID=UPI00129B78DA|nr:PEGA domain-containing protein [Foetidibacter luteolus]